MADFGVVGVSGESLGFRVRGFRVEGLGLEGFRVSGFRCRALGD